MRPRTIRTAWPVPVLSAYSTAKATCSFGIERAFMFGTGPPSARTPISATA